jgi:hypothetical protein
VGLLDELTGGGDAQQTFSDFVNRYDNGAPADGISPDEAQQRHDELTNELSPDQYGQAAQGAFDNLSPDDRTQVGQQLADQAQQQGIDSPHIDGAAQGDPSSMGQLAGLLHGAAPGLLGSVLGGGGSAGTGALAGIVANAARSFLG